MKNGYSLNQCKGIVLLLAIFSSILIEAFGQTTTFQYTGTMQEYTVPPGVTIVNIETFGAQGGNNGGKGAYMNGTFSVTPGQTLKSRCRSGRV